MKVAGGILVVLACVMLISGLRLALMEYDLTSTHDLSKFLGGMSLALGILTVGIVLIRKANARQPKR